MSGSRLNSDGSGSPAFENELVAYNEIVNSPYGKDMVEAAWRSLARNYPEASRLASADLTMLREMVVEALTFQEAMARKVERAEKLSGKMVLVKGGCFQMGSNSGDGDEKPVHEVCVDDFQIGKYEVTQGQWQAVKGNNPARFPHGDSYPVEQVSWDDVEGFINRLNRKTGKNFRYLLRRNGNTPAGVAARMKITAVEII